MTSIQFGLTAHPIPHQTGDFSLTLVVEETHGAKVLRRNYVQEAMSNQDAREALTDLRDMADRALRHYWPEDRVTGKHERGSEA